MKESNFRSLVKGVTWRIIASTTTMVLVYVFTGDLAIVASVGVVDVTAKIFFYYMHERVWGAVSWGMVGRTPGKRR